jgi:leucyl aminopeptidase
VWRGGPEDGTALPPHKRIAIVGKGVTFDSGGYNIKAGPGSMIELMKFDMVRWWGGRVVPPACFTSTCWG